MSDVDMRATRDGYGDGLAELGEKNKDVVVLTGDLKESTRVEEFAKRFPDRFIECGVAEQNMMGIAAGLAAAGKIPFISSYAVFSPGRSWDQMRVAVAYSNLNVKIAGAHTGVSVGPDGATHQALEDIAITRVLPNLTVVAPGDYWETKKTVFAAAEIDGPVYFRFNREKTPVFTAEDSRFQIGRAEILKTGKDVTIAACGPLVYQAVLAAKQLEAEKIFADVINNHTIKPMDEKEILASVTKTGAVVTVEEHQVMGGMGSAVAEMLAQKFPVPIQMIGVQDRFGESGQPDELLAAFGLTHLDIIKAVRKVLKRK